MKFKNIVLFLFAITLAYPWACGAQISDPLADLFSDEPEFLEVDDAFRFDFSQNGDQLILSFDIAEGYYLYKKQFKTVTKNAEIGEPTYPASIKIDDEFFDEPQDVFYERVDIQYPIEYSVTDGVVKLQYQGCAEAGLCYPPTVKVVYLSQVGSVPADPQQADTASEPAEASIGSVSEQFRLADLLSADNSLSYTLLFFLVLGIGLAFTPCVFPMYPILSGIVIGQGKEISTSKAFTLSFVYVQGSHTHYWGLWWHQLAFNFRRLCNTRQY
jgi:thiol:disulfide interchange protein DsbD